MSKQNYLVFTYTYLLINSLHSKAATVPLDLNFTHARTQKATARNIHGNAPE